MMNGDKLKEGLEEKSVDCILIDLEQNEDDMYRIILCELTKGSKELNDAFEKFKSSGKLIIEYMKAMDEIIYKIDCLLLGKIVKNGKVIDKKQLLNKFNITRFKKSVIIQNEKCNFSIKNLENN